VSPRTKETPITMGTYRSNKYHGGKISDGVLSIVTKCQVEFQQIRQVELYVVLCFLKSLYHSMSRTWRAFYPTLAFNSLYFELVGAKGFSITNPFISAIVINDPIANGRTIEELLYT
jgi:hypothetical protein